uniref:BPTI/Kunitz inhibitor domain-containing protein n=1 Tax=Rhinolophus ferrumequinum TaxID=59479 RepID=A0A671FTD2_RHIFE
MPPSRLLPSSRFSVLVSLAGPAPPKMGPSGLLLILVPFILLESVQKPGLVKGFINKAKCDFQERNQCTRNRHCPEKTKCCEFNCGKKCLDLKQDVCSLPKEVGPCLAYFRRWWYNKETKTCSRFIYGGCQGNSNNFQSESVCKSICSQKCKSQRSQSPRLTWATRGGLGVG